MFSSYIRYRVEKNIIPTKHTSSYLRGKNIIYIGVGVKSGINGLHSINIIKDGNTISLF